MRKKLLLISFLTGTAIGTDLYMLLAFALQYGDFSYEVNITACRSAFFVGCGIGTFGTFKFLENLVIGDDSPEARLARAMRLGA